MNDSSCLLPNFFESNNLIQKNRKEHLFYNAIHGIIELVARNKCIQLNIDVKSIHAIRRIVRLRNKKRNTRKSISLIVKNI